MPQAGETAGGVVFLVERRTTAQGNEPAIGLVEIPGQAHGEIVSDRHVDVGRATTSVEVTEFGLDTGIEVRLRLVGNQVDRATGGAVTVQGALRASQHLDPLQVEEGIT